MWFGSPPPEIRNPFPTIRAHEHGPVAFPLGRSVSHLPILSEPELRNKVNGGFMLAEAALAVPSVRAPRLRGLSTKNG